MDWSSKGEAFAVGGSNGMTSGLTEAQRVQALGRFAIIRPHVEEGVCQTELARVHQIPLRTVQNWVRSYREAGLSGLAKKGRSDRGKPRGLPEELVLLIEGLALQGLCPKNPSKQLIFV